MEMTTIKTVAVMAIIFGCFAVLYPKIFHPMILNVFGIPSKNDDDMGGRLPPHLRHKHPGASKKHSAQDDMHSHIRAGPHPGMRAAAEMKRQAAQQGSPGRGGGGMMSTILPMYAIGIVVYLIYTLSKVMGKKKNNEEELREQFQDVRFDPERKEFVYQQGGNNDIDDAYDDDYREYLRRKRKDREIKDMIDSGKIGEQELQKLKKGLFKIEDQLEKLVDSEDPYKEKDPLEGNSEMADLKRRLMDTEAQMERILKAMESVTKTVEQTADPNESLPANVTMVTKSPSKDIIDSSPDLDSYDVISSQKSSIEEIPTDEETSGPDVEEIGAAEINKDVVEDDLDDIDKDESVPSDENKTEEASSGLESRDQEVPDLYDDDDDDDDDDYVEEVMDSEESEKDEGKAGLRKRTQKDRDKDDKES